MRRSLWIAALTLAAIACLGVRVFTARSVVHGQAVAADAPPAVKQLHDPRSGKLTQIATDPATFAWEMFVYVNWPELPKHRGEPDPSRSIGDNAATVWESFKNASEVYLEDGHRPAPWEANDELPWSPLSKAHPSAQSLAALGSVDSNWIHFLSEPVMVDGQQICDADSNTVQYDVRGNHSYYRYVVDNPAGYELFNIEGQQAALADPKFTFAFPKDTLEIKASWRILEPGQDGSRYWTAIGVYRDNHRQIHIARIGLTGLHVISKVLPNWYWMTFEQVDNATTTFKYRLGEKSDAVGPNTNYDEALDPVNKLWQQALTGTKWRYYALMGTQTQFVNSSQQATVLGSTQMETYFQPNSSCISCHKLTSIGPMTNPRLKIFYPLMPYTGVVTFQQVATEQYPGQTFKEMDYAWSFRNAQYKKQITQPQSAHIAK
jgi:hypothetical protein